jgi:HD-like signal output (HDOD) protein/CheY-like chemotaxis protein
MTVSGEIVISLILMIQNEREQQVLKMALEQRGIKVLLSKPNYQNYILALQYLPDLILIEFKRLCSDETHFTRLIRKHRRTRTIPIIGYGDRMDEMIRRGILKAGISAYVDRPLKFSLLSALIDQLLKQANKKIETSTVVSDKEKDIELILNSQAMPMAKIEAMTRHVSSLMALPFTVAKVLRITQDETTGATDLSHAIQSDPAIATHLLKLSNSVFFASANRRIHSIKDAIVRIGFMETKKIVMSMTVMTLFDQHNRNLGFDRVDFWYHSLSTGIIAEKIARFMGSVSTEEAFLAGLLHDLGVIITDEFFPSVFQAVLEQTAKQADDFIDRQTAMLGFNYLDVIEGLFPKWKIPEEITEGITFHNRIGELKGTLDTNGKKLALCVGIGNILSKTLHLGRGCDEYVRPIEDWMLKEAHLGTGFTPQFVEDVYSNIDLFRRFLQLDEREFPREFNGIDDPSQLRIGLVNAAQNICVLPRLYLEKQGITIEMIQASAATSPYDNKFNLVLVWGGDHIDAADIEPYSHIVKYYGPTLKGNQRVEFAPILVFASDQAPISASCPEGVSVMSNTLDLRVIDLSIADVIAGRPLQSTKGVLPAGAGPVPVEQEPDIVATYDGMIP